MDARNSSNVRVRGTIIRVPDSGPGLLFANGQQKPFTTEGIWKSPVAPAMNMAVDVDIDGSGSISAVSAVDAQQIARERLNQLGGVAQEQGQQAIAVIRQVVGALAARMGKGALGATVVLWIAWFFLPAVTLTVFFASKTFTAWQFLGVDLSDPTTLALMHHGVFSLIGLLAIAAPLAAPFINHQRAKYLNAMPLAYLAIAVLKTRWDIGRIGGRVGGLFPDSAQGLMKALMDSISIGFGVYVLFIAGLVLAAYAFRNRPVPSPWGRSVSEDSNRSIQQPQQ